MLVFPVVDVMDELLEKYRPCLSKSQFQNLLNLHHGLSDL